MNVGAIWGICIIIGTSLSTSLALMAGTALTQLAAVNGTGSMACQLGTLGGDGIELMRWLGSRFVDRVCICILFEMACMHVHTYFVC